VDVLYELIMDVLLMPVCVAVEPLRDKWSSVLGSTAPFFHLLFVIFVPGLILAAPIAFSAEGLVARRVGGRRFRVLVAAGGGLVYALLSGGTGYVGMLGSHLAGDAAGIALTGPLIVILPIHALGMFGFWLPSIACGSYTALAKCPKWWVAGLLGTVTLIVGVWLWILLGTLVGAPND
jgi:hypothetical protein